ncbi:armadillo-type protein [Boletus reticuloceps]|uniref:Armadillo-type protein n=1 Tax=Boletus reticuloceps TaxID=495285 RepID=A0A8I2YCS9_9AGAM|nr:armadillo-type protein [Boletus reticuloceps]
METALAKIRPHTSSSLPHQKTPATLLHALESTLTETHTDRTPTAYFAALITTLDGTLQKKDAALGDGDVLPAILYLLSLVAPFVPRPVIQSNLSTLLSLTAPLFPPLSTHAPPLRSQLTLYNSIFHALDRSQLDTPVVRQSFATILQLCLDPRPKVRRRAIDLVNDVLSNPPSPLLRHPYAERVAEWMQNSLHQASSGVLPKSKSATKEFSVDNAIRLLALLRPILPNLPLDAIPPITTILLTLPRLGNPYLSQSSYSILSDLLSVSVDSGTQSSTEQIPVVLSAVLSSSPPKSDTTVAPSWLRVLGDVMLTYHSADPEASSQQFIKVWKTVWSFFETRHAQTRKAVAQALESLAQCITFPMARTAVGDASDGKSPVRAVIAQITKALDSLAYASAIPELLHVISSLILNLNMRLEDGKSTLAAEELLLPLVQKIADLRMQKSFEHKEAADSVISTAMRVMGPAVVLEALPLNLEPQDRQAGREPRAFLLPMLAQPHPSPLGHFVSYFVPLSERMFNLQSTAEADGRQSEAKVWNVLVSQVWVGFAGYCHAAPDVKSALTPAFSQLLSQLLYTQPELRLSVLKGLKSLVESSLVVSQAEPEDSSENSVVGSSITREEAIQNIAFLKTQVESWFAVFFNVFGSVDRESRGFVGDVISAWADIADSQEVSKAYRKVVELFQQNLRSLTDAPDVQQNANSTTMTQDLLILLLPWLEEQQMMSLVQICMTNDVLCCKDNGVQKRGYKILANVINGGKVQIDTLATLQQLDSFITGLSPAAKKDRFVLLANLVPNIPPSSLHIIPSLIPEAVLGTKEPSEKARSAAFELIVYMGQKMSEGGLVMRQMVDGMDEDVPPEANASINEYMTMVAGGLAGTTPHMISATVTAISRLVFEFKDTIGSQMQTEIFTTLMVFLSSSNREIVKSTLGYVKLAIHTLPPDLLRPHLSNLVPALLAWSHDHKNHFKEKVRHIFERMIRRFGWNDVYQAAGGDQASKVLVNIKKRKERAKRKRAREEGDEEEEGPSGKVATGDAFEDVLYGSESELDDSDDEEQAQREGKSKRKGSEQGLRLRDDGEPMDLLQGAVSRMTNAKNDRRRKPGQDANRFKTDEGTGKLVIPADNSDSDIEVSTRRAAKDVAGSAYRESVTSVDGFARGPNGRIKFNKDTKKRRRANEDEDGDIEMADAEAPAKSKTNKRRSEVKLGHEFKAKKAGGDVKKGNTDPYAYLPLSQAAKRKGRDRIGIAGKR